MKEAKIRSGIRGLTRLAGSDIGAGNRWESWWSRVSHDFGQFTTKVLAFVGDLLACLFTERHDQFGELKRAEQPVVVLPEDDDVIGRGQKLLADQRRCLFGEIPPPLLQQIELEEVVSEHGKDDLVCHHRESARGEMSQVGETLKLAVPLFYGCT